MRQRREDIRNIALIVGSGCLGALAVGIGLATATSVDVHSRGFTTLETLELHAVEPRHPIERRHRWVSIRLDGSAEQSGELTEARQMALRVALDNLEKNLDNLEKKQVRELETSRIRLESNGDSQVSSSGVRIKGTAGADPIVYVDGVRLDGGLEELGPDEIESIEVLKGSKATERYGEEGKKGVIVVTTRSGKKRKGGGKR